MDSPASLGNDHLGSKLVKFIPESLHLQLDVNIGNFWVFLHQRLVTGRSWGRRGTVWRASIVRLGLGRVRPRVAVAVLGRRAGLEVGFMLAVRIPRGGGEVIAPGGVEVAQAAGREGCNIAKMGQLRQPRTGYCWNHSKNGFAVR